MSLRSTQACALAAGHSAVLPKGAVQLGDWFWKGLNS